MESRGSKLRKLLAPRIFVHRYFAKVKIRVFPFQTFLFLCISQLRLPFQGRQVCLPLDERRSTRASSHWWASKTPREISSLIRSLFHCFFTLLACASVRWILDEKSWTIIRVPPGIWQASRLNWVPSAILSCSKEWTFGRSQFSRKKLNNFDIYHASKPLPLHLNQIELKFAPVLKWFSILHMPYYLIRKIGYMYCVLRGLVLHGFSCLPPL